MKKLHVKKGDTVVVLSGKSKDKKGKVLNVNAKTEKVLVEGVNMVTKHVKPKKQAQQGGIVHQEAPIYACKVMLVCTKCKAPTRSGKKVLENGESIRYCKKCGEEF